MKRLVLLVAVALTLVVVPLALGAPDRNKPTEGGCPNATYEWIYAPDDPADVNGNDYVCRKTVAGYSQGGAAGYQYIDDTAHNQHLG
jgi:hypothetical protein